MTATFYEQIYRQTFGEDAPAFDGPVRHVFSLAMRLYAVCMALEGVDMVVNGECAPELVRIVALIAENRELKARIEAYEYATGGRLRGWDIGPCMTVSDEC